MTDLATRPEQSNGYHKTITEHYASMSDALHHRDELVSQVKELETDLTVAQRLNKEYMLTPTHCHRHAIKFKPCLI